MRKTFLADSYKKKSMELNLGRVPACSHLYRENEIIKKGLLSLSMKQMKKEA
jgi:hypothetical protein